MRHRATECCVVSFRGGDLRLPNPPPPFFSFFTLTASPPVLQIARTTSRVITAYEFVTAANCLNGSISGQLIHCLSWSQARREKRRFSHLSRARHDGGVSPLLPLLPSSPPPTDEFRGIYKLVSLTAGGAWCYWTFSEPSAWWRRNQVLMM